MIIVKKSPNLIIKPWKVLLERKIDEYFKNNRLFEKDNKNNIN